MVGIWFSQKLCYLCSEIVDLRDDNEGRENGNPCLLTKGRHVQVGGAKTDEECLVKAIHQFRV